MQSEENTKQSYMQNAVHFVKTHGTKILFLIVLVFLAVGITLMAVGENIKSISVESYPAEVVLIQDGGEEYLEKTYHLTGLDDPALIPTEPMEWNGKTYHFVELIQTDKTESAVKAYTKTVTLDCLSKNMEDVLKVIAPKCEVTTEDGYQGELILNPASIRIEAKGYQNQSYRVTCERTYPNLAEADTSLIPKTITEKGRTLTLKDISWQNARTDYLDGYDLAMRYTAVATYDAAVNGRTATGYVMIADYTGEVLNMDMEYKAIYEKANLFMISDMPQGISVVLYLIVFLAVLALLAGAAYFGKNQYEHYLNRKRGYEA